MMFLRMSAARLLSATVGVLAAPSQRVMASWSPAQLQGVLSSDSETREVAFLDPLHAQSIDATIDVAFLGLQAQDDSICNDAHSSRYDPLACWLWKLKVAVPDQSFGTSLFGVKVFEVSCSNFQVEAVESMYIPSNQSQATPSIDLFVRGISASCDGKYHASIGASGQLSLHANGEDQDEPAMNLAWDFVSSHHLPNDTYNMASNYWMPIALTTQQCEANLKITDLHFAGSVSARFVNFFSGKIKDAVSSYLNEMLCPKIKELVDPVATRSILSAVRALTKYVHQGNGSSTHNNSGLATPDHLVSSAQREVRQQSPVVDFEKDTPLLMKSLKSVNHFLDCYFDSSSNASALGQGGAHDKPPKSCSSLITKAFKEVLGNLANILANEVHLPTPKELRKVEFKLPHYGRILLDIQDLYIRGLDQLDSLELLSPVRKERSGPSDFRTRIFGGKGLNLTAYVNITIFPIPGGIIHGGPLHEAFLVRFNVSTFDALGIWGLELRKDRFQEIQIGTILDSFTARFHPSTNSSRNSAVGRNCLLEAVESLQLKDMVLQILIDSVTLAPQFNVTTGPRTRLSPLTDKLERDLDDLISHGIDLVLREYQPLLTDSAAGFAKTELVTKVNYWIEKKLRNTTLPGNFSLISGISTDLFPIGRNVCRSGDIEPATPKLFNFTTLGFLNELNDYINKPSTLSSINNALDKLASEMDRHHGVSEVTSLMPRGAGLDKSAIPGVSVLLRDLQIDDVGSIRNIEVLSPELDGLHLKYGFAMGVENLTFPTIRASFLILYRPRNLSAMLNATLSLDGIVFDGGQFLRFDTTRFRRLSMIELFSRGHCWVVPFQECRIYNNHNMSHIVAVLANASVSVVGDVKFENFTAFMDTVTYPSASTSFTSLIGWTFNTLQQGLNSAARSSFEQAEGYCTGGQQFGYDVDPPKLNDGYVEKWLLPVLCVLGSLVVSAQAVFLFVRHNYKNSREQRALSTDGRSNKPVLTVECGAQDAIRAGEENHTESRRGETLVQSTALTAFSRQAVPVFIFGTLVLLLSSNISSGATVDLRISWNDSHAINLPAIFTFSFLNTANEMWQAGIYPLFFLVLIMSGIWPYSKLLLMLGAWTSSTAVLKPKKREKLLLVLDALGKFALTDFLLFVLMMVAFRYHLDVTETISVDIYVNPETGFYSFLAATCFSLVIGHFLVYCHRLSEMRHLSFRQDESDPPPLESVLDHDYVVGYSSQGEHRLRLSRRFRCALVFTLFTAVSLLAVGITQKSFKFEIGGIAGDILGDKRTTYYSLLSLGSSMRRSVKDPSVGILILEVVYYFYAVVAPFSCLGILFILAMCPMTLTTQRFVLVIAETANAWSAVEVFVIAMIASMMEISTFASFMVGHRCDLIKKILKEHFESAITEESDATCFTVRSYVENSCWGLILGVLLSSVTVSLLLRLAHCSVTERIESEMKSSLGQPSEDALSAAASNSPSTVAGQLHRGCIGGIIFDTAHGSGLHNRYGYIPQALDTFSVVAEVDWHDGGTLMALHSDESPPISSTHARRERVGNYAI